MIKLLVCSYIKDPVRVHFEGEDSDEALLYILRKSFITNLPWMIMTVVIVLAPFFMIPFFSSLNTPELTVMSARFAFTLTLFFWLFAFGFFFQNFLNWFFNVYIITNKRILDVDFKGILYKNISETPLTKIEDVTSNISGFFPLVFHYGNVLIQTAAEQREFEFEKVDSPGKVRDIISNMITKKGEH